MKIIRNTKDVFKIFSHRYGLPVNFQAMLLHPNKKNTKRLRDVLHQLYGHLDSSAQQGGASGAHDVCIKKKRDNQFLCSSLSFLFILEC